MIDRPTGNWLNAYEIHPTFTFFLALLLHLPFPHLLFLHHLPFPFPLPSLHSPPFPPSSPPQILKPGIDILAMQIFGPC